MSLYKDILKNELPDHIRASIWLKVLNIKSDEQEYKELLMKSNKEFLSQIERDLPRTYPNNRFFNSLGRGNLKNVLLAFSSYNPNIGYCQGLGFMVGLLLLYFAECEAFYVLIAILERDELHELYTTQLTSLEKHQNKFLKILEINLPEIYKKFDANMINSITASWFLTLFSSYLPIKWTVRIWDYLIVEGFYIFYNFCLAFFIIVREELLVCSIYDLNNVLKQIPINHKMSEILKLIDL